MSRLLHRQRLDKRGHPTGYCRDCHTYAFTVYRQDEECPVRLRRALAAYAAAAAAATAAAADAAADAADAVAAYDAAYWRGLGSGWG